MGELVDLDDVGDRALQERAVVADENDARGQPGDEPLQPVEAVEVEVVRRLVEQVHVEPAEEQRGQTGTCCLAAAQHGHRTVEQVGAVGSGGQAEVVPHLADAGVEVGAAERQPAVECVAVRVVGSRLAGGERCGGGVECRRCVGHARPRARYSRTVSSARRSCSWGRKPIVADGGADVTRPDSGSIRPASVRSSVLLPTPFGPTTPIRCPGATVRSTRSSTIRGPRLTVTSEARSEAVMPRRPYGLLVAPPRIAVSAQWSGRGKG